MDRDHLGIVLEDIRGKFDLVLEGHDALRKEIRDTREELGEKIKLLDFKVETLNQKIDAVASDLAAHRRDTEAHVSVYKVKDSK
jgi:archaellum component FlaC